MDVWNGGNPIDFYWRKHFKIPFGSKEHLEADLFDQQIWYEELVMYNKLMEERESVEGGVINNQEEVGMKLDEFGDGTMSEDEFDNLDMTQFQ